AAEQTALEARHADTRFTTRSADLLEPALDERGLDVRPQPCGEHLCGAIRDRVVELVEEELLLEHPVQERERRHGQAAAPVDRPGAPDACKTRRDGRPAPDAALGR